MSEFEDSMQTHSHENPTQVHVSDNLARFGEANEVDWTEDVRTRDYYPTRFEFFLKDILCGMLSRTAPKEEKKVIAKAFAFTRMVEDALDKEKD